MVEFDGAGGGGGDPHEFGPEPIMEPGSYLEQKYGKRYTDDEVSFLIEQGQRRQNELEKKLAETISRQEVLDTAAQVNIDGEVMKEVVNDYDAGKMRIPQPEHLSIHDIIYMVTDAAIQASFRLPTFLRRTKEGINEMLATGEFNRWDATFTRAVGGTALGLMGFGYLLGYGILASADPALAGALFTLQLATNTGSGIYEKIRSAGIKYQNRNLMKDLQELEKDTHYNSD